MNSAIFLDLDGTLWDSSLSVTRAWNEKLKQLGIHRKITQNEICSIMGLPMNEIALHLFPQENQAMAQKILSQCCAYENEYISLHGGQLYPNLKEVLETLKKDYFIAIVSNCQTGYIEAFLKYYHLYSLIDDFESFGNTGKQKAENICLVKTRNHLNNVLYVGDIEKDQIAAAQAGIPFIWASYGMGKCQNCISIASLSKLPLKAKEVFQLNS